MRDTSSNEPQPLPPPPGIIGSLRTGFDVVAAHITAILMPVALDLLLWLGPHLRIDQLMSQTFKDMLAAWSELGITPEQISQAQDSYTSQIVPKLPEINLFASLRTFPVGVASLLAASRPLTSPLGTPLAIQINSIFELMVCAGGLTLIGWFYGALYFRWIAALVTADTWVDGGRAISQTLLYSFIWSILFWI